MIDLLVGYYENDSAAGDYFVWCAEHLQKMLSEMEKQSFHVVEIKNENCNADFISNLIGKNTTKGFIFIAYCHGSPNALYRGQNPFVKKDGNTHLFSESFFYSTACHAARGLGPNLLENGCPVFIGYDAAVTIVPLHADIFIACQNHGLQQFLTGRSAGEAYFAMWQKYNQAIDDAAEGDDLQLSVYLQICLDACIIYGDHEFTIRNLN